jgi:hypothetical protein
MLVHNTAARFSVIAASMGVTAVLIAAPKFTSVWKSPDAEQVSFAGKKVAGLVITKDDSLRVAGEDGLVRELTGRGLTAVATYTIAPKEELVSGERAKGWFERAHIEGVVAMRPVSKEKRETYTEATWIDPFYSSFWGYYGYGWASMPTYIPGYVDVDTFVVVETTIYSVPQNKLVWAAVSETKNPKDLRAFLKDLSSAVVKELHKQGLAKKIAK